MGALPGRSTRSLDVTVNQPDDEPSSSGPSERAIVFARASMVISGSILVAFGIGIAVTAEGVDRVWGIAIAVAGIANFIAPDTLAEGSHSSSRSSG